MVCVCVCVWTGCGAWRLLRLVAMVVGIKCMCSWEMMVHFLVKNVKSNPLKVRPQSLCLGRARMFTGAELWDGIVAQLQSLASDIGFLSHWLSKSITPSLTTVSVQLMPSFPSAPSPLKKEIKKICYAINSFSSERLIKLVLLCCSD